MPTLPGCRRQLEQDALHHRVGDLIAGRIDEVSGVFDGVDRHGDHGVPFQNEVSIDQIGIGDDGQGARPVVAGDLALGVEAALLNRGLGDGP